MSLSVKRPRSEAQSKLGLRRPPLRPRLQPDWDDYLAVAALRDDNETDYGV